MKDILFRIIAINLLLTITACGGGGGDSPAPANNTPPVIGNLDNGATITGKDGVAIHALNDTLSAPMDVNISAAAAPTEAMWPDAQVVGDYYQLSASQDTYVSTGSPFVLSFPVPAGADTTHLALAVRIASEAILDGGRTGWEWLLLDGFYNATENTFLTTLPFLAADGRTFVLVTHPDFESPVTGVLSALRTTKAVTMKSRGTANAQSTSMVSYDFNVNCTLMSAGCSDAYKQGIADAFSVARTHMTSMGFSEPALEVKAIDIGLSSGDLVGLGYKVFVVPQGSSSCKDGDGNAVDGNYYASIARIFICVPDPASVLTPDVFDTIVHEYFHATQFAYPAMLTGTPETWLIEGTATAAEKSFLAETGAQSKMFRTSSRNVHTVDIELRSTQALHEYEAQDFWVYAGRKLSRDLDSLIPILDQGGSIDAINANLVGDNLKVMYWNWIKNDVFEKTVNTRDEANPYPCSLDTLVANDVTIVEAYKLYMDSGFTGNLAPLSSIVLQLVGIDGPIQLLTPMLDNPDANLVYKVYIDEEPGCEQIPDGERALVNFDPFGYYGTPKTYYVVISNTDFTQARDFTLRAKEAGVF